MSEIDYSQYYMQYSSHGNKKSKKKQRTVYTSMYTGESEPVKKKRSKGAYIIVLVLLSFIVTAALAEFLCGGAISSAIARATSGGKYIYAVVTSSETYSAAVEMGVLVRVGGGGGNVVDANGEYLVVLSAYPTESDAKTVSERSDTVEVRKFAMSELKESGSGKKYAEQFNRMKESAFEKMYNLTIEFAKGVPRAVVLGEIKGIADSFNNIKTEINADPEVDNEQKLEITVAIDTICGRLSGIEYVDAEGDLLSNMRYQTFSIAVN